MEDQKDNKINPIGHKINPLSNDGNSQIKEINKIVIHEFINKKTEKLITALYMVTDYMESGNEIKSKLRLLGIDLMSHIFKISVLYSVEKHTQIKTSVIKTYEIISFIEIASTIGFISEMNAEVLKREFNLLASSLKSYLPEKEELSFILDHKMLEVDNSLEHHKELKNPISSLGQTFSLKNNQPPFYNKRTNINYINNVLNKGIKDNNKKEGIPNKEDRVKKIIEIIKDSNLNKGQESNKGISIKDITNSFKDCSEKTIQRELNDLVSKGQLKKVGEKRWSRYSLNN